MFKMVRTIRELHLNLLANHLWYVLLAAVDVHLLVASWISWIDMPCWDVSYSVDYVDVSLDYVDAKSHAWYFIILGVSFSYCWLNLEE